MKKILSLFCLLTMLSPAFADNDYRYQAPTDLIDNPINTNVLFANSKVKVSGVSLIMLRPKNNGFDILLGLENKARDVEKVEEYRILNREIPDTWSNTLGKVKKDEDYFDAAKREGREEMGLDFKALRISPIIAVDPGTDPKSGKVLGAKLIFIGFLPASFDLDREKAGMQFRINEAIERYIAERKENGEKIEAKHFMPEHVDFRFMDFQMWLGEVNDIDQRRKYRKFDFHAWGNPVGSSILQTAVQDAYTSYLFATKPTL